MGIPLSPTCTACRAELWAGPRPLACRTCFDIDRRREPPTLCLKCLVLHQIKDHGRASKDVFDFLRGQAAAADGALSITAREILHLLEAPAAGVK